LKSFNVIEGLYTTKSCKGSDIFGRYVNPFFNEKKKQDELLANNDPSYNNALRECIKLYLNSYVYLRVNFCVDVYMIYITVYVQYSILFKFLI
jgi:hypothetical protein